MTRAALVATVATKKTSTMMPFTERWFATRAIYGGEIQRLPVARMRDRQTTADEAAGCAPVGGARMIASQCQRIIKSSEKAVLVQFERRP